MYRDVAVGIVLPFNVRATQLVVSLEATFPTQVCAGTSTRAVWGVINNHMFGAVGSKPNPWNEVFDWSSPGVQQGTLQGLILQGSGWSSSPTGPYRLVGHMRLDGVETYTYNETYVVRDRLASAAW
jgi:hypothetical protein